MPQKISRVLPQLDKIFEEILRDNSMDGWDKYLGDMNQIYIDKAINSHIASFEYSSVDNGNKYWHRFVHLLFRNLENRFIQIDFGVIKYIIFQILSIFESEYQNKNKHAKTISTGIQLSKNDFDLFLIEYSVKLIKEQIENRKYYENNLFSGPLMQSKKEWTGKLYLLALLARKEKHEEESYNEVYKRIATQWLFKGQPITAKQLKSAWDSSESRRK